MSALLSNIKRYITALVYSCSCSFRMIARRMVILARSDSNIPFLKY